MDATATAEEAGAWLPVKDAAPRLGLTLDQLRRKLRRGEVPGRQVPTPTGHAWLVWLVSDDGRPTTDGMHAASDDGRPTSDSTSTPPPVSPQTALLSDRAAEMARYSRELLAPVLARLEAQATQIGRLEERTTTLRATVEAQAEEIGALRAQLAAAPPASVTNGVAHTQHDQAETVAVRTSVQPPPDDPPAAEQTGRSWWRRWLWG